MAGGSVAASPTMTSPGVVSSDGRTSGVGSGVYSAGAYAPVASTDPSARASGMYYAPRESYSPAPSSVTAPSVPSYLANAYSTGAPTYSGFSQAKADALQASTDAYNRNADAERAAAIQQAQQQAVQQREAYLAAMAAKKAAEEAARKQAAEEEARRQELLAQQQQEEANRAAEVQYGKKGGLAALYKGFQR